MLWDTAICDTENTLVAAQPLGVSVLLSLRICRRRMNQATCLTEPNIPSYVNWAAYRESLNEMPHDLTECGAFRAVYHYHLCCVR
jgi:hypothetical protein